MLKDILTFISVLTAMLLLKSIVSLFPSLAACMIRSKECFNLFGTGFMNGWNEDIRLAVIVGLFVLYIIFRDAVFRLFRPQRIPKKTYMTAGNAAHTFFVILTLILLATGGVMTVTNADEQVITTAMLWISATIYIFFIFRKFEIFTSSCSLFTAFLYLCALEIIPTGTWVISAIIL